MQFVLCGIIQLVVDLGIAYQMHCYWSEALPSAGDLRLEGGPQHLNFRVSPEHDTGKGNYHQGGATAVKSRIHL